MTVSMDQNLLCILDRRCRRARWPQRRRAAADPATDADTTSKISSETLESFTARAITRAPTMLAKVTMAFLCFTAADLPGVNRARNSRTEPRHSVTTWRTGAA